MAHTLPIPADVSDMVLTNGQVGAGAKDLAGRLADRLAGRVVRLDFAAVDFIGSQEVGALVLLNRKVRAAGGRLALVNVRPLVADVFDVTRLTTLLDVRRAPAAR